MTSTSYINYPSDRLSKRRGSGRTSIQTLLFCLWFSKQESFLKSCCGKSSINVFFPSILRNRREGDLWCPILWFDPLPQGVEEIKRIFVALCVTGYTGNKNFRSCGVWFFYRNAGRVGPAKASGVCVMGPWAWTGWLWTPHQPLIQERPWPCHIWASTDKTRACVCRQYGVSFRETAVTVLGA